MANTTAIWAHPVHKPGTDQLIELGAKYDRILYVSEIAPELARSLSDSPSDRGRLLEIAEDLIKLAERKHADIVQPGGSPAFQFCLGVKTVHWVQDHRLSAQVFYAHSKRVSVDEPQPDGTVVKRSVFKHLGFH